MLEDGESTEGAEFLNAELTEPTEEIHRAHR